ncbi:MAG: TRAP transporter small permease [Candidatus Korobacteraceae bacterium]|jgi:TRAP-type C4-dicarboxylate transport system permease small subunit
MSEGSGDEPAIGEPQSSAGTATIITPSTVAVREAEKTGALAAITRVLDRVNQGIMIIAGIALLGAALVLTYGVITRYFLKVSTDWQDEASVFLIVGSIFMCGAYVQSQRGHVGIEALASILPESVNRIRKVFIDIASFAFCAFFSWKSWEMFHEAFSGGYRTESTWAPPLWIPYGLLALGMANLSLQLLVQVAAHFTRKRQSP